MDGHFPGSLLRYWRALAFLLSGTAWLASSALWAQTASFSESSNDRDRRHISLSQQAEEHFQASDYAQALIAFSDLDESQSQIHPELLEFIRVRRLQSLGALKRFDEALRLLKQYESRDPAIANLPEFLFEKGRCLAATGMHIEARKSLTQCVQFLKSQNKEGAHDDVDDPTAVPLEVRASWLMAETYVSEERFDDAKQVFENLLQNKKAPWEGAVLLRLGMCAEGNGETQLAITFYEQARDTSASGDWQKEAVRRVARLTKNPEGEAPRTQKAIPASIPSRTAEAKTGDTR